MSDEQSAPSVRQIRRLIAYLQQLVARYETPEFIARDPISIPHGFDDPHDREVIGLYAALLAWGRRDVMLRKLEELCERMQFQPARFVRNFNPERDAHHLAGFKHRTFQPTDAFWLTQNLSRLLNKYGSIETLFTRHLAASDQHVGAAIQGFSESLLQVDPATPKRLRKHLARPQAGSACKRINMYLRWMVRNGPVDFGQWAGIDPSQLLVPLDVHSGRQARELGLLARKSNDWKATLRLTEWCRLFSQEDPAQFDFALFGVGANDHSLDTEFTGPNRLDPTSLPTSR